MKSLNHFKIPTADCMVFFFHSDECSRSKSVIGEKQNKKKFKQFPRPKNIIFISFFHLFIFFLRKFHTPVQILYSIIIFCTQTIIKHNYLFGQKPSENRILHYQLIRTETPGEYNCLPGQLWLLIKIHFILQICLKFIFCACIFEQH